jgi:hypothetical protein
MEIPPHDILKEAFDTMAIVLKGSEDMIIPSLIDAIVLMSHGRQDYEGYRQWGTHLKAYIQHKRPADLNSAGSCFKSLQGAPMLMSLMAAPKSVGADGSA